MRKLKFGKVAKLATGICAALGILAITNMPKANADVPGPTPFGSCCPEASTLCVIGNVVISDYWDCSGC